jgi:SWIM/SEC-C metal-binding protein
VARLGSPGRPAIARVQTLTRAHEIVTLCDRNGWKVIVGVEPDKPEDVSDVTQLLRGTRQPTPAAPVSRNAPCSCGSGRKYKRCCGK